MKESMKRKHAGNVFEKKIFLLILFSLIILTLPATKLYSSSFRIFLISKKNGVFISENNGKKYEKLNNGLPDNFIPIKIAHAGKNIFLITRNSGIFKLSSKNAWENISSNDFLVRTQYKNSGKFRKISAFNIDYNNPNNIILATKHTIYRSVNSGNSWNKVSLSGLGHKNYITAAALSGNTILAGTSFNGLFMKSGSEFIKKNNGLPKEPYSGKFFFYDEIRSIFSSNEVTLAGLSFGMGLYASYDRCRSWKKIPLPPGADKFSNIEDVKYYNGSIFISIVNEIYRMDHGTGSWFRININPGPSGIDAASAYVIDNSGNYPPMFLNFNDNEKIKTPGAANKKALYSSVPVIRNKSGQLLKIMKKNGFNSIVIDMKDDFGNIYYPTNNETASAINSAKKPINIKKILDMLKSSRIYTIARIVVFKDEKMFRAFSGRYAIKNKKTGAPWKGTKHEYWVDPHSEFVQNYNIDLAVELEKLGFDEIQFDYIRFPSDGNIDLCEFSFRKDPDTYKSEILVDFLNRAKDRVKIPISVDIYGFNSWYHFGNWIGQDMEEFSYIVDAISPMVYPSHFGSRFYMKGERHLRPYRIVYYGGMRANMITSNRVIIRPYLQAFRMSSPTWGPGYIKNQIKGALESGCQGFIFWNASGDYKIFDSLEE